jgi:hypothetical protein
MSAQAGSDPGAFAGPWCCKCGSWAEVIRETLDSRYPVVVCKRGYPSSKGCGEVIGSRSMADADRAYKARRRKLTESRHKQHDPARPERHADWCRHCERIQAERSHMH